jgi:hypothetical protein
LEQIAEVKTPEDEKTLIDYWNKKSEVSPLDEYLIQNPHIDRSSVGKLRLVGQLELGRLAEIKLAQELPSKNLEKKRNRVDFHSSLSSKFDFGE